MILRGKGPIRNEAEGLPGRLLLSRTERANGRQSKDWAAVQRITVIFLYKILIWTTFLILHLFEGMVRQHGVLQAQL